MADLAVKRITEVRNYVFVFSLQPEFAQSNPNVTADTLASIDSIFSVPVDGALIIGTPAIIDWTYQGVVYPRSAVKVKISGGTQEAGYNLYCRCLLTSDNTLKLTVKGILYVGDGA